MTLDTEYNRALDQGYELWSCRPTMDLQESSRKIPADIHAKTFTPEGLCWAALLNDSIVTYFGLDVSVAGVAGGGLQGNYCWA